MGARVGKPRSSRHHRNYKEPSECSESEFEGSEKSKDETYEIEDETCAAEENATTPVPPDEITATTRATNSENYRDKDSATPAMIDNDSIGVVVLDGEPRPKAAAAKRTVWKYEAAANEMTEAFWYAGHTTVRDAEPDESHPLHTLYKTVLHQLDDNLVQQQPALTGSGGGGGGASSVRLRLSNNILRAAKDAANKYMWQTNWWTFLPAKADVLALRFMSRSGEVDRKLTVALARCNSLHLLQVLDGPGQTHEQDARNAGWPGPTNTTTTTMGKNMHDSEEQQQQQRRREATSASTVGTDEQMSGVAEWAAGVNEVISRLKEQTAEDQAAMAEDRAALAGAQEAAAAMEGRLRLMEEALEKHGLVVNGAVVAPVRQASAAVALNSPATSAKTAASQRGDGLFTPISNRGSSSPALKRKGGGGGGLPQSAAAVTPKKKTKRQEAHSPSPSPFTVRFLTGGL